jgi:hypothetical protein
MRLEGRDVSADLAMRPPHAIGMNALQVCIKYAATIIVTEFN